jgi:hypothetical protein
VKRFTDDTRKTNSKGQLRSMVSRLTSNQMERRSAKIVMRVGRDHAQTRGMVHGIIAILRRGFFGCLKWLVAGR